MIPDVQERKAHSGTWLKLTARSTILTAISIPLAVVVTGNSYGSAVLTKSLIDRVSLAAAGLQASSNAHGLIEAAREGNVQRIEELLERDLDVDAQDGNGVTALMVASRYGHSGAVTGLLNHGADVNAQANNGWTALMWATALGERGRRRIQRLRGGDEDLVGPAQEGRGAGDPDTWTAPWTVNLPMQRNELPMFEYACHEGN